MTQSSTAHIIDDMALVSTFPTFAHAYRGGLRTILERGHQVSSVTDPDSIASGFGAQDRPYSEIIGHSFQVADASSSLAVTSVMRVNLAYCFGLLAWSLDARNDIETPSFYRRGADQFSDDQHTLSGAFGRRLRTLGGGDQLRAIIDRLRSDPTNRRTFAPILEPVDNFRQSREYPCGVGVQMFLRDQKLSFIVVMRAQQALTVLPYDTFLFMGIQQYLAGLLDVECGPYHHYSGTFHIYDNERAIADEIASAEALPVALPTFPRGKDAAEDAAQELIDLERQLREAVGKGDHRRVDAIAEGCTRHPYTDVARAVLARHAYRKLGATDVTVASEHASERMTELFNAI
ncbi:thymidylate synthase [Streptomyces canus]|uniref:thymidylate synthase n=1 Tax=Streptomyces canus TaxID=58343 RepID=UPI00339F9DA7